MMELCMRTASYLISTCIISIIIDEEGNAGIGNAGREGGLGGGEGEGKRGKKGLGGKNSPLDGR